MPDLRTEEFESADTSREESDPNGLSTTLYAYQRQALAWMIDREKTASPPGGILADEVGLGKTVEIIALILQHRSHVPGQCGATLIVSPQTITSQWKDEIERHAPGLKLAQFLGSAASNMTSANLAQHDVILVTYEVLTKELWRAKAWREERDRGRQRPLRHTASSNQYMYEAALMELDWWRVVLDEVQYAKGGRNAGRMVRMLRAEHRWAVSGTPMRPGVPQDMTQLLSFVCHDTDWLTAKGWDGLLSSLDQEDSKAQLIEVLKPLFLRRTKAACDAQLNIPAQRTELLYVDPTPAELALRDTFVLRNALQLSESRSLRASEEQAPGVELTDDVLGTHLQLSTLSPQLWGAWGASAGSNSSTSSHSRLVAELRHFTLAPEDIWQDMEEGVNDAFKARRQALNEVVNEGLKGLLPDDETVEEFGMEVAGSQAYQDKLKRDKKRRLEGGKQVVSDMAFLQLLVAISTLAKLSSSQETRDAMAVVYKALSTPSNEASGPLGTFRAVCNRWCLHPVRKMWLTGMDPVHALLPVGKHTHGGEQLRVPSGMPRRWAELEPFLWLHFREYTSAEIKEKVHSDSLGFEVTVKARRHVVVPANNVWIGRAFVTNRVGDAALTDAKRRICLNNKGAITLPFAMALECGDVSRARLDLRRHVVRECGGLATGLDKYPYVTECATGDTLDSILSSRGAARVDGWACQRSGKLEMIGPQDTELLMPLRRSMDPEDPRVKIKKCKQAISTILKNAGQPGIEAFASKLRQRYEKLTATQERSLETEVDNSAAKRARITRDLDVMWARQKSFQTDAEAAAAKEAQTRLRGSDSSKVRALLDLLSGRLQGEKAVVFTAFAKAVPMLKRAIQHELGDASAAVSVMTLTTKKERAEIAKFKSSADCRVLVLQAGNTHSGAGASGLTLTVAKHVVLMDVLPDPMVELQAIARVHRVGQTSETTVWHVVSRGSVDVMLRHLGVHRGEVRLKSLIPALSVLPSKAEVRSPETRAAVRFDEVAAFAEADEDDAGEMMDAPGDHREAAALAGPSEEQGHPCAGTSGAEAMEGVEEHGERVERTVQRALRGEAEAESSAPAPLMPPPAVANADQGSLLVQAAADPRTIRKRKLAMLKQDFDDGEYDRPTYEAMVARVYKGDI